MRVPAILLASTALLLYVAGCDKKEDAANAGPKPGESQATAIEAIPVVNPDDQLAEAASARLVDKFSTELKNELTTAIANGGPASAVNICYTKAPQIARAYNDKGWEIKRVSRKLRNPANKMDSLDSQVLRYFETDKNKKLHKSWTVLGDVRVYAYYRPIYATELCLNCHGDPATMDPKVTEAIAAKYPADQATGYKAGDLRGMFVVHASWPLAKASAEQIINE